MESLQNERKDGRDELINGEESVRKTIMLCPRIIVEVPTFKQVRYISFYTIEMRTVDTLRP